MHSYELLLIYTLLVYWLGLGNIWYGIGLGMALHLILDNLSNPFYPNMLFLINRKKAGFEYAKIIDIKAQKQRYHKVRSA